MKPSFDPGALIALSEVKGELQLSPLPDVLKGSVRVLRISQSKSALKNWRRAYEFFQRKAASGRKEISNGNCNS